MPTDPRHAERRSASSDTSRTCGSDRGAAERLYRPAPYRPWPTSKMSEPFQDRRGRRLRAAALGTRFALELCILASLAAFAAQLPVPVSARVLLGVLFCVIGAAVWGA